MRAWAEDEEAIGVAPIQRRFLNKLAINDLAVVGLGEFDLSLARVHGDFFGCGSDTQLEIDR